LLYSPDARDPATNSPHREKQAPSMQSTYILQPISSSASAIAEIVVPAGVRIQVGRETNNDVALPHDLRMSSVHFELCAEPGGCRVRDLRSSNGLFLNTKRIAVGLLVEGDELQAGESRWRVAVRGGQMTPYTSEQPLDQSLTARPPMFMPAPVVPVAAAQEAVAELQLTSDRGVMRRIRPAETLTVGRTPLANWVFDHDGQMSSLHLEFFHDGSVWRVKDLQSSNGSYLNETRIDESPVRSGDEIRAGQTRFVVALLPPRHSISDAPARPLPVPPPPPHPTSAPEMVADLAVGAARLRRLADGREFELRRGQLSELGRGLDLPISLADDLEVSTLHATVMFDGEHVQLHDAGSSNGTFVNGKRVVQSQLTDGQRFRVGKTELLVCLPIAAPTSAARPTPEFSPWAGPRTTSPGPRAVHNRGIRENPSEPIEKQTAESASEYPAEHPLQPRSTHVEHPTVTEEAAATASSDAHEAQSDTAPHRDTAPADALETPSETWSQAAPTADSEPWMASDTDTDTDTDADSTLDSEPASVASSDESLHPAQQPDVDTRPAAGFIDWNATDAYATQSGEITAEVCRSGLYVCRGVGPSLDPVDVGLRVLQTTSGWVLNGGDIENWMEAARQGLSGQPREWLNPARADDASWMPPFLSSWGTGQAWLVFSSVDLDEALRNILSLRPIADDAPPLMPALTPMALATFLADHEQPAVERFFQPFDAILLEITAGKHWALFSQHDLTAALRQ
jgi:pSer/pThr/pTyr-binding forkhead associated (FHA) protein